MQFQLDKRMSVLNMRVAVREGNSLRDFDCFFWHVTFEDALTTFGPKNNSKLRIYELLRISNDIFTFASESSVIVKGGYSIQIDDKVLTRTFD